MKLRLIEAMIVRNRVWSQALNVGKSAGMALIASALILWSSGAVAPQPVKAQQPAGSGASGSFSKFGKVYINLSLVTHIIDEPGENLPPGSMRVHFSGGPAQNFINLFGEDAEALRRTLEQPGSEPVAPAAKKAPSSAKAAGKGKRAASPYKSYTGPGDG